jgi:hypothetical protein
MVGRIVQLHYKVSKLHVKSVSVCVPVTQSSRQYDSQTVSQPVSQLGNNIYYFAY